MTPVLTVLAAAAGLVLFFLFLIAPGYLPKDKKAVFWGRNIAHRGLFSKDQSVPENSLSAFRAAKEARYGVELDVRLSRDGEVVVFHDDTLSRACGIDARVDSFNFAELEKLSLFGTGERIPLFSEVLGVIGKEMPLVVELKTTPNRKELCRKTLAILGSYGGEFCIESFDPLIVGWFRFHAPRVMRGQLSQPPGLYKGEVNSGAVRFLLGNTLLSFIARPQFIAYRIGAKPFAVRVAERLGAMRFAWTGHDAECETDFDSVIFEHHLPVSKYK